MDMPQDGLISHYTFENVTDGVVVDEEGNHDFLINGSPDVVENIHGTGVRFNAPDQYLLIDGNNIFTTAFSIVCVLDVVDEFYMAQGWDYHGGYWSFRLQIQDGQLEASINTSTLPSGSFLTYMLSESQLSQPILIVLRMSTDGFVLSVNDVVRADEASGGGTLRDSTAGFTVGVDRNTGSDTFLSSRNSIVAELAFFSQSLTDEEVHSIYLQFVAFSVSNSDPVAINGDPSIVPIFVFNAETWELIGRGTTDSAGNYFIPVLNRSPVYVIATPPEGYSPKIVGPVIPTLRGQS